MSYNQSKDCKEEGEEAILFQKEMKRLSEVGTGCVIIIRNE